jgi:hypothetical protein
MVIRSSTATGEMLSTGKIGDITKVALVLGPFQAQNAHLKVAEKTSFSRLIPLRCYRRSGRSRPPASRNERSSFWDTHGVSLVFLECVCHT